MAILQDEGDARATARADPWPQAGAPAARAAPEPDWDGFLQDAALLFEAEPDLAMIDAGLEPDATLTPPRPLGPRLPDGFRFLRVGLFVEAKPGKSLPAGCALALLLAAQTSWIERGIARLPDTEEPREPGPAPYLLLNWISGWPQGETAVDATFGPVAAFADKALSWFFPSDPNAPRGVEPYRAAQFVRRAPEFRRLAQTDSVAREERKKALSNLPAAGAVSFLEAVELARKERLAANFASGSKVGRFTFSETPDPIQQPVGRRAPSGASLGPLSSPPDSSAGKGGDSGAASGKPASPPRAGSKASVDKSRLAHHH